MSDSGAEEGVAHSSVALCCQWPRKTLLGGGHQCSLSAATMHLCLSRRCDSSLLKLHLDGVSSNFLQVVTTSGWMRSQVGAGIASYLNTPY